MATVQELEREVVSGGIFGFAEYLLGSRMRQARELIE